jgi:hypothetical protein
MVPEKIYTLKREIVSSGDGEGRKDGREAVTDGLFSSFNLSSCEALPFQKSPNLC